MIEYTYLIGSAQSTQTEDQDGRSPTNHYVGKNLRIPSHDIYKQAPNNTHTNTQASKQATTPSTTHKSQVELQHEKS